MLPTQRKPHVRKEDDLNIYPTESRLYHFPDIKQLGQQFDDVAEINRRLDILLKNHNLMNQANKIEKTLINRECEGGYLFRCKISGCQAFLKFHYTANGRLMLAKSDIEHEHKVSNRMSKGRLPKIKNSQVEQCYDELQLLNFRPGEIVNFIRTRFKISRPHFYAIKYGRNKRQTIKNLLMTLSKYDHFFFECKDLQELAAYYRNQRLKPEKRQDRDVVIVVSRKMKQLYEGYHGEYVLFSIFPELVLESKNARKTRYHNVGVLYGEDSNGSVNLLFGIIFMRKSIRLAYLYVLEKLFNFLGKYPKVFITDYDQHLTQAVRRLQKKTIGQDNSIKFHLQLPNSFIINSFQARTAPQFLSILSNDLQGLLREPDRNKHEERLKVILKAVEYNPPAAQDRIAQLIKKFVKANSVIYLPPLFFGLSITPYSTANYLRSRVLDFFKSPRPLVLATKAIFQIFQSYPVLKYLSKEQIQARLNPPKQCSSKRQKIQLLNFVSKTYESATKMKTITKSLSQSAALCFHDNLQKCFTGQLQMFPSEKHTSYRVVQTPQNYPYVIHHIYETRNNQQVAVWRCNCLLYSKLGLPCWHEIKVCIEEKASLLPQIGDFWLKQPNKAPQPKRGRYEPIQHDVKFWNEDDAKFNYEQQQNQKIQLSQHNHFVESQVSKGLYNIKINQNQSENDEDDEEYIPEKENQGINDIINQLNDLRSISIKENDQYDELAPNAWDNFSKNERKSQHQSYYDDNDEQDLHIDQKSLNKSFKNSQKNSQNSSKPNKTSKILPPAELAKLKSLKANNHSNKKSRQFIKQKQEDNFDNLNLNLDFFEDDDQIDEDKSFFSRSQKIGNQYLSNYNANLSQNPDKRFSYKSNPANHKNQIQSDDEYVINESQFNEQDFDQNDFNFEQDSGEEWQRTSYNKINSRKSYQKKQQQEYDIDADFNFNFEDQETERYVPFDKDYYNMELDDDQ